MEEWERAWLSQLDEGWRNARTLEDLGELTVQWLDGQFDITPDHWGPPDPETHDLIPALTLFNRNGFVTNFSQPGEDVDGWVQRAAVGGYCAENVADRIQTVTIRTDLIVLAGPMILLDECQLRIPITLDGGKINTVGCVGGGPHELRRWRRFAQPELIVAMGFAWEVMVIDPRWGRNDLLWDEVAHALQDPDVALEWVDHNE